MRRFLSADSAWSSLLALLVAVAAVVVGISTVGRVWSSPYEPREAGRSGAFLLVAVGALFVVSARFSRRTLRILALVLLVLTAGAVLGLGRAQVHVDRRDAVTATVARLRAELEAAKVPESAKPATVKTAEAVGRDNSATPHDVEVAVAQARRDVAKAVADSRPKDEAAAKAAVAAEKAYLDAVEDNGSSATPLLEAVPAGAEALWAGLPAIGDEAGSFDMPAAGWLVVAGVALAGYRAFETRTGRSELLLASVERTGGKTDDDDGAVERFRTYISRNIPEPGAVPGASSSLAPVTDLLSTAAAATPAGPVAKVLAAAVGILRAPRGACVSFSVVEDSTAGAKGRRGTMVAVRLCPRGSGEQLQQTVRGATLDEALRSGAYWAAAVLIERSHRVPPWAVWSPEAADALATYYAREDTGLKPKLKDYEVAVQSAPRSGLLLVELANRYALHERLVDSFAVYLRAAVLYPRWPVARYRLAATATMLATDDAAAWGAAPQELRDSVLAVLRAGGLEMKELGAALATGSTGAEARRALCGFAEALLDHKKLVGLTRIFSGLLRSTERSYWATMLRTRRHVSFRTQFSLLARSACTIGRIRRTGSGSLDADLKRSTGDDEPTWQLAYNLACASAELARHAAGAARAGHVATAIELLELAVTRPGGQQLNQEWLRKDPDLAPLRAEPRFHRLRDGLPKDTSES